MTPDQVIAAYRSGAYSIPALAKEAGWSVNRVYSLLLARGVPRRKPWERSTRGGGK